MHRFGPSPLTSIQRSVLYSAFLLSNGTHSAAARRTLGSSATGAAGVGLVQRERSRRRTLEAEQLQLSVGRRAGQGQCRHASTSNAEPEGGTSTSPPASSSSSAAAAASAVGPPDGQGKGKTRPQQQRRKPTSPRQPAKQASEEERQGSEGSSTSKSTLSTQRQDKQWLSARLSSADSKVHASQIAATNASPTSATQPFEHEVRDPEKTRIQGAQGETDSSATSLASQEDDTQTTGASISTSDSSRDQDTGDGIDAQLAEKQDETLSSADLGKFAEQTSLAGPSVEISSSTGAEGTGPQEGRRPDRPHAELYQQLRAAIRWQMRSTGAGADVQKRAKFRATAGLEAISDIYLYWKKKRQTNTEMILNDIYHLHVASSLAILCFRGSKLPIEADDADHLRKEAGWRVMEILEAFRETELFNAKGGDVMLRYRLTEIQALEWTGKVEEARAQFMSILQEPDRRSKLLSSAMSSNQHRPLPGKARTEAYREERKYNLETLSLTLVPILQGMHIRARLGARDSAEVQQRLQQSFKWLFEHVETFGLIRYTFDKASVAFKHLVSLVEEPLVMCKAILSEQERQYPDWKATKAASAFSAIARTLVSLNATLDACDVYRWCTSQSISLPETVGRRIIRVLSLKKEYVLAERIAAEVRKQAPTSPHGRKLERSTLKVLVKLYAQQGHETKMEEEIRRFVDNLYAPAQELFQGKNAMPRGSHDEFFRKNRLMCYAVRGDVEKCKDMLIRHYDVRHFIRFNAAQSHRAKRVQLQHVDLGILRRLLQAYIVRGLLADAEELWDRMSSCPPEMRHLRPDTSMFNSLLAAYVVRNDLGSAASLWDQMRERPSFIPTRASFTTMMNLCAERQDVEGARKMLETMIHEYGHEPDRAALTALMNAHVESGSWQGAVDIFEWMHTQPSLGLRPSTGAYNTLIKMNVLRGAPARYVITVLSRMLEAGIVPDERTYALVMQSACDAGLMERAEDIFEMADRKLLTQTGVFGEGCNAYHFTIMIHAYHRLGLPQESKEFLDEMQRRGVEPTAITWSSFVKMYADRASDDPSAWQSALDFVRQLASVFHKPISSLDKDVDTEEMRSEMSRKPRRFAQKQGNQLLDLYDPLINSAARQGEVQKVETLIRELIDQGTRIPLRVWTTLLDAFRRRSDVAGCLQVWSTLLEQAKDEYDIAVSLLRRGGIGRTWRARNLVSVPLSILIDALTTAGKYETVVEVWTDVKTAGFAFDAHNWNHLCVTLVRGGWIGQALDIIEEVLYDPPPSASTFMASPLSSSMLSSEDMQLSAKGQPSIDWVQKLISGDGHLVTGNRQDDENLDGEGEKEHLSNDDFDFHVFDAEGAGAVEADKDHISERSDAEHSTFALEEDVDDATTATDERSDDDDLRPESTRRHRRRRQKQVRNDFALVLDPSILDDTARRESALLGETEDANVASSYSQGSRDRFTYDLSSSIAASSPWFAHYNTLKTLHDSVNQRLAASRHQSAPLYQPTALDLDDAAMLHESDGAQASPEQSMRTAMMEQLRKHPKARSLLADFSKRLEAVREKQRLESQRLYS